VRRVGARAAGKNTYSVNLEPHGLGFQGEAFPARVLVGVGKIDDLVRADGLVGDKPDVGAPRLEDGFTVVFPEAMYLGQGSRA
jgi:hypothetical protein